MGFESRVVFGVFFIVVLLEWGMVFFLWAASGALPA
jgi:hypothetical protein